MDTILDGEMNSAIPPWMDCKTLEFWLQTPVNDCLRMDAAGKGDNYLSDLHRIVVKTEDIDISLIVKCHLEEGSAAEMLKESTIFRKEQEMYSNTLPRMDKLLSNALSDHVEPLAPKCYYSCKSFLVMEDLSALGYTMMDRQTGLDLDQCLVVMRSVATLHAASIALHEKDPDSMREYPENFYSDPATKESHKTWFTTMLDVMIEELETWPQIKWAPYVKKLRHILPDFYERVKKCTSRCDTDFNVLIHGDVWTNNILYRDDVMRLIDFQFVQYTSFAVDLHMFLTTSPKVEVRINHTDRLIKEYHTTLCNTMTSLGCKRKLLTLEELYEEFDRKAMYGVFGLVCAAPVIATSPKSGFDLSDAMKGKTPGPAMYSEYFRHGMKWALPFLDNMGVFDEY